MDDVDRIEVISRAGRDAVGRQRHERRHQHHHAQGGRDAGRRWCALDGGAEEQAAALRYGGDSGRRARSACTPSGSIAATPNSPMATSAEDDWSKVQAGFRVDSAQRQATVHRAGRLPGADAEFRGVLRRRRFQRRQPARPLGTRGRPRHHAHAGVLRSRRSRAAAHRHGVSTSTPTTSISSRALSVGARHRARLGTGPALQRLPHRQQRPGVRPDHRTLELTNVFVQDAITLNEELKLTAGIKFEDNSYSDWSALPDLRLSWAPNDKTLFWIAGSRAIRSPTPFDTDVQEFVGGQLFVLGDPDFKTEKVTAYELGYRGQPRCHALVSASVFYDEYDDLRTIELTPVVFLPLRWGNLMEGSAYGVEAWANIQLTRGGGSRRDSVRCTSAWSSARAPRASSSVRQAGNDPSSRCYLKSSMDLRPLHPRRDVAQGRRAARTRSCDDYTELNARFAWRANERLEVAVKGFNLLNETHLEYPEPAGHGIRRSVMAELRYSY